MKNGGSQGSGGQNNGGNSSAVAGMGGGTQKSGGGDRGVVETGGAPSPPSPQPQQPTADPSENARRMVESLRQGQQTVEEPVTSRKVNVQDFLNSNQEAVAKVAAPKADAEKPKEVRPRMSTVELLEKLNPQPSAEELRQERRRARRSALFSAIGDGIAALSNLHYTTKYAPNAYNPEQGLSKKAYERYEKLRKEREENRQQYTSAYIRAMQADALQGIRQQRADAEEAYKKSQAEKNAAMAKAQQEVAAARAKKDAAATALAEQKLEYMKLGWPVELATKQAKLDYEKARAARAQTQADNTQREYDDKHEVAVATVGQKHASATNSYAQAGKAKSGGSPGGGSGSGGGIPWYDRNGVLHHAKTEAEAKQQAKLNGTYVDDYVDNTSNRLGITGTSHTHNGWHSEKPKVAPKPKAKPRAKTQGGKKSTGVSWK